MICIGDFAIHYIELPIEVPGVSVEDKDGFYNIYINCLLSEAKQREALLHEFVHIMDYDFCKQNVPIEELERKSAADLERAEMYLKKIYGA